MIQFSGVSKAYPSGAAVRDLTLEIERGELCILIGPSGCGKTTTLRMVNRLIEPTGGQILIDGRDSSTLSKVELRRGMGYAIQGVGLFPHLTVASNIAVVPKLLGWAKGKIEARVAELLELIGLPGYTNALPSELSGGQAQRVGVARALAADPPIMLMDEPFGAVDPLTRERLQDEFLRLQRTLKKTVVFVTHDMDEAIKLADRVAIMREGQLVQFDTPEALLEQPANAFVRDFVGADRGLKRLSRVRVREAMRPTLTVRLDDPLPSALEAVRRSGLPSLYVVDANGMLRGWLEGSSQASQASVRDAITAYDWREISVQEGSSVREALSRMVSLGFQSLAVVNDLGQLQGEITLEAATQFKPTAVESP